ncbi:MAG: hypothetical protein ACP5FK_12725 [bacterium]
MNNDQFITSRPNTEGTAQPREIERRFTCRRQVKRIKGLFHGQDHQFDKNELIHFICIDTPWIKSTILSLISSA